MKETKNTFTIFVSSSDGFEDCWHPFFTLFEKFWSNCKYPILLNTEYKDFSFKDLNIISTKAQSKILDRELSWCERFIKTLEQAKTPLILYFQEDYFLDMPVNVEFIEKVADLMLNNPEIKRVGLVTNDAIGKLSPSEYPELWEISMSARYIISTQTSLWRKDALLEYLHPEENIWMFEIFGTWRARKRKEKFLSLNRNMFVDNNKIVSYLHTGVIKGKWHPEIPKLFKDNNIEVDFTKRGFYNLNIPTLKRKIETFRTLLSSPKLFFKALYESI